MTSIVICYYRCQVHIFEGCVSSFSYFNSVLHFGDGLRAGRSGFWGSIPGGGWEFFSSPPRPERL